MKRLLLFSLLLGLASCTDPVDPEGDPPVNCWDIIIINGVTEQFCDQHADFKSNLETSNPYYVQYRDDLWNTASSRNFESYNVAFANNIPDSSDWESEALFFEELIQLFRPESKHPLDINVLGGFAIEVWDLNGEYFSSEFGVQDADTFIETRKIVTTLKGPVYSQVYNYLEVYLVSTNPVKVWNQSGTESLTIDLDYLRYLVGFSQFRE